MKKIRLLPPRSNNKRKGFTLIELIIVIVIIAILAAIAIPAMNGYINDAKQATSNANAKIIYDGVNYVSASLQKYNAPVSHGNILRGLLLYEAGYPITYEPAGYWASTKAAYVTQLPISAQNETFMFQGSVLYGAGYNDNKVTYKTLLGDDYFDKYFKNYNGTFHVEGDALATFGNFYLECEYDHPFNESDLPNQDMSKCSEFAQTYANTYGVNYKAGGHFNGCNISGIKSVKWFNYKPKPSDFVTISSADIAKGQIGYDGYFYSRSDTTRFSKQQVFDFLHTVKYPSIGEYPVPPTQPKGAQLPSKYQSLYGGMVQGQSPITLPTSLKLDGTYS